MLICRGVCACISVHGAPPGAPMISRSAADPATTDRPLALPPDGHAAGRAGCLKRSTRLPAHLKQQSAWLCAGFSRAVPDRRGAHASGLYSCLPLKRVVLGQPVIQRQARISILRAAAARPWRGGAGTLPAAQPHAHYMQPGSTRGDYSWPGWALKEPLTARRHPAPA